MVQWQPYRSSSKAGVGEPGVDASTLARLEIATEKVSTARRKSQRPSRLEQAAEEWKTQQQQRGRLRFQPELETSVTAPVRMPLRAPLGRSDETIGWALYRWRDEDKPRAVTLNAATVSRIAQHLKAREWARAMRKGPSASLGSGLDKWAATWKRDRELEERRLAGSPTSGSGKRPA